MSTVVERSVDIHATADDAWRILAHDFADGARLLGRSGEIMLDDVRTFLETGGPSPAKQKTTERFARRDRGSNVAVQR